MKLQNGTAFIVALAAICFVILGCGGQTCVSELTVEGKSYRGTDPKSEQAILNSCTGYCIEGDAEFDAAYKKWLETPEAKKVSDREKKWAAYAESKELNAIADRCSKRCKDFVSDGVYTAKVECK